ncbi:MAG: hypothetical protein MUO26_14705 [Methanotrichaceae archaeon]|nr:hypothetical protein [Methanotrichaceae archaeon]
MTKEKKIEIIGERLLAVQQELVERELSPIPTPKLYEIMFRLSKIPEQETVSLEFMDEHDISAIKASRKLNETLSRRKMTFT